MRRIRLLGVVVDLFDIEALSACIAQAIEQRDRIIIAHHNMHGVYLYHRDPKMRAFFKRAKIIYIDGMPLVYWARILGYQVTKRERVTCVDWICPLVSAANTHGWRIFYLGGKPGVAKRAAERLRKQYSEIVIATRHGYFGPEENDNILNEINDFHPHILMVGMGMPRQEHWVLDNLDRIQANVIVTVGACFDYIAGVIPTPPRWMGRMGLEWLYRLFSEPRRLWRRYLVEPWALIPFFLKDLINIREHRRQAQRLASSTTRRVTAESVSEKLS